MVVARVAAEAAATVAVVHVVVHVVVERFYLTRQLTNGSKATWIKSTEAI